MERRPKEISLKQLKRHNQAHHTTSSSSEEEEEALEMERNFALLSKHGAVQKSDMGEEDDEDDDEEEDEEDDEDDEEEDEEEDEEDDEEDEIPSEDCAQEHMEAERSDMPWSEDSPEQRLCRRSDADASSHTNTAPDLSTMSFEEIMSLQSKVGTKICKKLTHEAKKRKLKPEPAKQVTKDRPQELSAKKPVSFLKKVGSAKAPISRDPRFDDLSGEFKPEVFSQTYRFISDIRQREAEMVKKKLKKVKSDAKKQELKSLLKRMENQKRIHERHEQQREKELGYKRKQRALVGDGHKPFYLKKSDKKKLHLAEKYSDLKKSGKLENFLSKKRKRNAVKDRRKLP